MVLGCPVLTTDCAGMMEILENGKYGIIVDNDYDGIKEGLFNVLTSPQVLEKLRSELSNKIVSNNVDAYEKLIDQV